MLEREFGAVVSRIAVGRAGHGSECFGYDDEVSRDHDYFTGFRLWITEEDEREFGFRLERAYLKQRKEFPPDGEGGGDPGSSQLGDAEDGVIEDTFAGLARKSTRAANLPCAPLRLRICIDVMEELGLIRVTQTPKTLRITLTPPGQKVDLNSSRILAWLSDAEAGTADG